MQVFLKTLAFLVIIGAQPHERETCRVTERQSLSALCGGRAALSAEDRNIETINGANIQGAEYVAPSGRRRIGVA